MGFKKVSAFRNKNISVEAAKNAGFTLEKDDKGELNNIVAINLDKLCLSFMEKHRLVYHRSGVFYQEVNGVHVVIDDNRFSRVLKDFLNKYAKYLWSKPLDGVIRNEYAVHSKRVDDFDVDKSILNLKSGLFDLNTYEQKPHTPDHHSIIQLPIHYDPNAECPLFDEFLKFTFNDDEELIDLVTQMMGYMLTAETKAEKAFLFLGNGSNGKSTLIKVIAELVGRANICTVPLSDLGNSFTRLSLMGKLVCACTENEKDGAGSSSFQTGMFKAIISGDDIDVEIKNGARFSITPTVKFMFAFNSLPSTKDATHGFFRKLIIIPFNRIIDENMKNPQLPYELKNELDGIFNVALRGLARLRSNNYKFPIPQAVKKELSKYRSTINPLIEYISDNIEVLPNNREFNKVLYQDYKEWADDTDLLKEGREFMGKLKLALDNAGIKYKSDKSNGKNYLAGIKIKEKKENGGAKAGTDSDQNGEKRYSI